MKKYIIAVLVVPFLFGCDPVAEQRLVCSNYQTDWLAVHSYSKFHFNDVSWTRHFLNGQSSFNYSQEKVKFVRCLQEN